MKEEFTWKNWWLELYKGTPILIMCIGATEFINIWVGLLLFVYSIPIMNIMTKEWRKRTNI